MTDSEPQELETTIHQRLGRFMLRVQRYEMVLKALVVDSVSFGTVETATLNKEKRRAQFANKPMGYLFDEVKDSYLRELGAPEPEGDHGPQVENGRPVFRARFSISLPTQELAQTKARLDAFRDRRNRIVHHFLEDHDLLTREGCEKAVAVLEDALETAQSSYEEILRWAKAGMEAAQHFAAFAQSPEFEQYLHGILPDGTVDWPNSTAVRLLRLQEKNTAPGKMTRLDVAVDAIRAKYPEHRPPRYFCQNWGELLKKSGQFQIRKERGNPERKGVTWYRSVAPGEVGAAGGIAA